MLGSEVGIWSRPTDWRASEVAVCCPWPVATACPAPGSWPWLAWPRDDADRLDLCLSLLGRRWHWMWVLRWPEVLNRSSQKGHLKGLEPVWRRMCTFKLPFVEKEVLHMWQLNSFWPAKTRRHQSRLADCTLTTCLFAVKIEQVLRQAHFIYFTFSSWTTIVTKNTIQHIPI